MVRSSTLARRLLKRSGPQPGERQHPTSHNNLRTCLNSLSARLREFLALILMRFSVLLVRCVVCLAPTALNAGRPVSNPKPGEGA